MAIINTFEKCLQSPYLIPEPEAAARIGEMLTTAADRLEAAANLENSAKGDPADVVLLSYEAMFCCLRSLLYAKGYREKGLLCLILACEALYVVPGELEAVHLRRFEDAQRLKLTPNEAVQHASALVKRTLQLLG